MGSALRSPELLDRPRLLQVQCRYELQQLYQLLFPLRRPHCHILCAHISIGSGELRWLAWASRCMSITTQALFADFSTTIPSPLWALNVAEVAAPYCLIVRLILACNTLCSTCTPPHAHHSKSTGAMISHPNCVAGSRPEMSH